MNSDLLLQLVFMTLVHEMGYAPREAVAMVKRHKRRCCDALEFLPRRLAMQIEKEETSNAERLAR